MTSSCCSWQVPAQVLFTLVANDPIRSVAYDPAGVYTAGVTCNGTLHVWEIKTRTSLLAAEDACPEVPPWLQLHAQARELLESWHCPGSV